MPAKCGIFYAYQFEIHQILRIRYEMKTGGQPGNTNASHNKPFAEALRKAIAQAKTDKLRAIADALLNKAAEGDMSAIKELADRTDGKPVQAVESKNTTTITVNKIELVAFDGHNTSKAT